MHYKCVFYAVILHKYNKAHTYYKRKAEIILFRFSPPKAVLGANRAKLRAYKSLTYSYMNGILFI